MSEIPHSPEGPGMSPEFDRSNYPDQLGCKTLPSIDGQTVTAEIKDVWGDLNTIEGIRIEAVTRISMPRVNPRIESLVPDEAREALKEGAGLSIVACRKEELEGEDPADMDAPIKVNIPTISGDIEQTVRRSSLARKVN